MTIIIKNKETLIFDDFIFKCCVGKNGITNNSRKGRTSNEYEIPNLLDI